MKVTINGGGAMRAALTRLDAKTHAAVDRALKAEGRKLLAEAFADFDRQALAYRIGKILDRRLIRSLTQE